MAIDGLSVNGHFLSMVTGFVLKTLFQSQGVVNALEGLLCIYRHPHLHLRLGPALNSLCCFHSIARDSVIGLNILVQLHVLYIWWRVQPRNACFAIYSNCLMLFLLNSLVSEAWLNLFDSV